MISPIEKRADTLQMLHALADPVLRNWIESQGMLPGPVMGGSNYDYWLDSQFQDELNKALYDTEMSDPATKRLLKGFATMTGEAWTDEMDEHADQIHRNVAQIAPYLAQWAPDVWDKLHGGRGSVAAMTLAISNAAKDRRISPLHAAKLSEGIYKQYYLSDDPMIHRGLPAGLLGKLYGEGLRSGSIGTDADTIGAEIGNMIGPVSAVRDMLGIRGKPTDPKTLWDTYLSMSKAMPASTPQQLEDNLRQWDILQRQGGPYAAAYRRSGQAPGGVPLDRAVSDDIQLREQLGGSEIGNLFGATHRLQESGLLREGTPGHQLLLDAQEGGLSHIDYATWKDKMLQSGISPGVIGSLSVQTAANRQALPWQTAQAARSLQYPVGIKPLLDAADRSIAGLSDPTGTLREGQHAQVAAGLGYDNREHMNQLHGKALSGIPRVMQEARADAVKARQMSGISPASPISRGVDAVMEGREPGHILGRILGGIPKDRVPDFAQDMLKGGAVRGIPDRKDYGDITKLKSGALSNLIVQLHEAIQAKTHHDVRIGDSDLGLLSWAVRKGLPEPGKKHFASQQPAHTFGYSQFQGYIKPGGYGAGKVTKERDEKILITSVSPNKIHFSTASKKHPERFVLVKPKTFREHGWLLINITPTKLTPYQKIHYTSIAPDKVEKELAKLAPGSSVQAKIDGASSLVSLVQDGMEVTGYRTSKSTGRPIVHSEKFFGGRPKLENLPTHLQDTVLKGELYGVRPSEGEKEQVIPPQELGGLLNATIQNSLIAQKSKQIRLMNYLYDVQRFGGKDIDPKQVPYSERRKMLEEVHRYLPQDKFALPEQATTPEDATALWNSIGRGEHPLTNEGVVIHPATGKPIKAKYVEDVDVTITDIFPGSGKYEGVGAGGFAYEIPGGTARVGTGFSDETRREMWANPSNFIGRKARIRSQQKLPSGAYRTPSFLALHEDR